MLLLALISGCGAAQPSQPNSREVKLLLEGARFEDPAALEAYWALVRGVAAERGVEIKGARDPFRAARRSVAFIDTAGGDLRRRGFSLRRRVKYKKSGALKKKAQYTLKRRADSIAALADPPLTSHDPHPDFKLEEDVVWRVDGASSGPHTILSLSVKVKTKRRPPMTIAGFAELFPTLTKLGLPPETPLQIVREAFIDEIKVEPGVLRLKGGLSAQAALSVWRVGVGPDARPMIAEFSFDHPLPTESPREEAIELLKALHARSGPWLASGGTKTQRVYGD